MRWLLIQELLIDPRGEIELRYFDAIQEGSRLGFFEEVEGLRLICFVLPHLIEADIQVDNIVISVDPLICAEVGSLEFFRVDTGSDIFNDRDRFPVIFQRVIPLSLLFI